MKILGVNGIRTHGKTTTDRLLFELEKLGHNVLDINQPIRHAWGARFKVRKDAKAIIKVANDGDVLLAHSYGCMKAARAMRGINFKAVFLFRPAMGRYHDFPGWHDTEIYCIHSRGDLAVWAGGFLLFHPFGLAGVFGFKDNLVQNIRSSGGHSADFKRDNVANWASFINDRIG